MNALVWILIDSYSKLLQLYPSKYRAEFEEQMLLDFSDMVADAREKGKFAFFLFCMRELVEFPGNLLRAHWTKNRIFKLLRSQPINIGLKSALGFGIAFALTLPVTMFAYQLLMPIETLVTHLQVLYYDLFHVEQGFEFISWIPSALSALFTGLVLGLIFAVLLADRSNSPRVILTGAFGWFFYRAMYDLLTLHFNFWVYLDSNQYTAFNYMQMVFFGTIFGLSLLIAKSKRRQSIRWLGISIFVCPLLTYLYLEQLFTYFVIMSPWRFIGSTIWLVALIISVFILARKIDGRRKIPFVVIAGAVVYPVVMSSAFFFAKLILHPTGLYDQFDFSTATLWRRTFMVAIEQAVYGTLIGLFLGLGLGFQEKNGPAETVV